jgi:hypothetical protein
MPLGSYGTSFDGKLDAIGLHGDHLPVQVLILHGEELILEWDTGIQNRPAKNAYDPVAKPVTETGDSHGFVRRFP